MTDRVDELDHLAPQACKHNVAYTSLFWISYAQGCDLS